MAQTGITLAVIVKNEAKWLRQLLDHHAELYDEAVVVDTGSADGSRAVALAAGATVLDFAWCDDFSAARNFGLAAATGRWILTLDCDERIASQDFPHLLHLATAPAECIHSHPQWNYTPNTGTTDWEATREGYREVSAGSGGFITAWSSRLFPNDPEVRFAGCVHETVIQAGNSQKFEHRQSEIPIHHYGHLPGWSQGKNRKELYFQLLEKKIKLNPQDSAAMTELACQLFDRGQLELSRRMLDMVVRRFPTGPEVHRARLLLGRIHLQEGQDTVACDQFAQALRDRPDWRPCWVESARAAFIQGDREKTRCLVREGRRLFPLDPHLKRLEAKVLGPCGR